MKNFNRVIFLSFFFLSFPCTHISIGQEPGATQKNIKQYLNELEEKYHVKFSFVDNDVRNITFFAPSLETLDQAISYISKTTVLQVEKINNRYYSIVKKKTISICGYVLDNFEQNTISGATVQILDSSEATITNLDGSFTFDKVSPDALIQIKHLGFKPLFIRADGLLKQGSCRKLALALSYQELPEVTVYKFLTSGLTKAVDGSIAINTKDFGILPGQIEPDILQTVQALPGIKSVDETVSDINIRGGTNDQNLLLWDDIKMYQSGHFFGLISAFNPYVTESVSVSKNGTSAQYGDGLSGVIAMNTKNTMASSFSGGAGFNLISGDFYGQLPITENVAFQFSARRSFTDVINTPTFTVFSEKAFQDSEVQTNNDFYFYDVTGKLLIDISPNQKARFSIININNNLDYLETETDGSRISESNLDQNNVSFGGNIESSWTDDFESKLTMYYTQYQLNAFSIANEDRQALTQNNQVLEMSVKLATNYKISNNLKWLNGYHGTETGITNITDINNPELVSKIKEVMYTHSVFSEITYAKDKFNGVFGGRLNYLENTNTFQKIILEPRLNLSYTFAPNLTIEMLGQFKSQATNQIIDLEQNFLGIEKRRWVLANEDTLPVTQSKQASLGFNYDENSFYIGIEGYYKAVDGINIRTQGFQNQNQFLNQIGSYAVKGLEVLMNKKNATFSTWLSYTYNLNNYTFGTETPPTFANNLDVRHAATLGGTYTKNNVKFGIGLHYRSGTPYTKPDATTPINTNVVPTEINYENTNTSRLPEYIRADASVNYDFNVNKSMKASLGASVLNLTNRENILNTFYRLSENDVVETVERTSLGVTPNMSLRIWF